MAKVNIPPIICKFLIMFIETFMAVTSGVILLAVFLIWMFLFALAPILFWFCVTQSVMLTTLAFMIGTTFEITIGVLFDEHCDDLRDFFWEVICKNIDEFLCKIFGYERTERNGW